MLPAISSAFRRAGSLFAAHTVQDNSEPYATMANTVDIAAEKRFRASVTGMADSLSMRCSSGMPRNPPSTLSARLGKARRALGSLASEPARGRPHAGAGIADRAASGGGQTTPGWSCRTVAVVGGGGGMPSRQPPTQASRADQGQGDKVVRPVGRSTLSPWPWPAPRCVGRRQTGWQQGIARR